MTSFIVMNPELLNGNWCCFNCGCNGFCNDIIIMSRTKSSDNTIHYFFIGHLESVLPWHLIAEYEYSIYTIYFRANYMSFGSRCWSNSPIFKRTIWKPRLTWKLLMNKKVNPSKQRKSTHPSKQMPPFPFLWRWKVHQALFPVGQTIAVEVPYCCTSKNNAPHDSLNELLKENSYFRVKVNILKLTLFTTLTHTAETSEARNNKYLMIAFKKWLTGIYWLA